MFTNIKKNYWAYLVILGGMMGTYAAFSLLLGRIEYYKNPNYVPPCSINIWLDCGIVMKSKWATLFGFPNTIIGLITYPSAILTGFMMLLNPKNNSKLMNVCLFISSLGLIMNIFLLYISSYIIASLCPWCVLAGVATSNIFFSILFYNITNDHLVLKNSPKYKAMLKGNWDIIPVIVYYIVVFALVYLSFFLREQAIDTTRFFDPAFWLWGK